MERRSSGRRRPSSPPSEPSLQRRHPSSPAISHRVGLRLVTGTGLLKKKEKEKKEKENKEKEKES